MIPLSHPPKLIEKKGNSAVFEIDALYPGYGVTVGNSLRRVLLSSLSGAAVTQMKIKGASHEFSTLPGVLEDTILIMLNLKQLRFKLFTNDPQKAVLKVKGEKEAKGSDFDFSPQVELVNKNAHVATLTGKSSELEIEIQIEKGVGYSSRDERGKEKLEVGVIPLDAIFTPIKRVSFRIDNMRVGERTDFDRLFLDIETDGTLSPEEALFQASEILVSHFSLLADAFRPKAAPKPAVKEKPVKAKKAKKAKKERKTKARSSGKRVVKKKKK